MRGCVRWATAGCRCLAAAALANAQLAVAQAVLKVEFRQECVGAEEAAALAMEVVDEIATWSLVRVRRNESIAAARQIGGQGALLPQSL